MSNLIYSIPNYLTFFRIILIPVFVYLLVDPTRVMVNVALAIFIFAAITDYVDGFIARRWGAVSDFGKLLDPIADKILVMAALVMLTSMRSDLYGDPWVPGWIVVLVIAREIWITGLRAVAASRGTIVPAGNAGKIKSFLQMIAIIFLFLHDYTAFLILNREVSCYDVGFSLLVISLALSLLSAINYSFDILSASDLMINSSPGNRRQTDGVSAIKIDSSDSSSSTH